MGAEVGGLAGVAVGAAVGLSVGVRCAMGVGVGVASGVGVFAGAAAMLAGICVSVGSGADVTPVQANRAIGNADSTTATRGKSLGFGGCISLGEVSPPFYRLPTLVLSPCCH